MGEEVYGQRCYKELRFDRATNDYTGIVDQVCDFMSSMSVLTNGPQSGSLLRVLIEDLCVRKAPYFSANDIRSAVKTSSGFENNPEILKNELKLELQPLNGEF